MENSTVESFIYGLLNEAAIDEAFKDMIIFRLKGKSDQELLDECLKLFSKSRGKYDPADIEAILEHYITYKTNKIDFGRIVSSFPDEPRFITRAVRLLSPHFTNIWEFTINAIETEDGAADSRVVPRIDELILNEMCKMKSLVKLEFSAVHFTMTDLMELCGKLPSLKDLSVKIAPLPQPYPFKNSSFFKNFKKSFSHLKTFDFSVVETEGNDNRLSFQQALTRFCVLEMPNLEYLGDCEHLDGNKYGCKQEKITDRELRLVTGNKRFQLRSIKHLTIIMDYHEHHLQPVNEANIANLLKFKSLRCLQFKHMHSVGYLELFLRTYGKSLKNLIIQFIPEAIKEFRFLLLYSLCPKLRSLVLHDVPKLMCDAAWALAFFPCLKELDLKREFNAGDEPVRLSDILSAPKLVKVKLMGLLITNSELIATERLVRDGKILTKITHFTLVANAKGMDTDMGAGSECIDLEKTMLQCRPKGIFSVNVSYLN